MLRGVRSTEPITDRKAACAKSYSLLSRFRLSIKDGHFMKSFRLLFSAKETLLTVRDTVGLSTP